VRSRGARADACTTRSSVLSNQAKRLGDEAFKSQDYAKAIEHYTEAIKENPKNGAQAKHVLLSNRSAAHAASKQWDKALEDALACIQAKPDFSKAWSRKGAALVGKGDRDGAEKAYRKCLDLDPNNAAAKAELQRLEFEMSQRSAAFSNMGAKASAKGNAASAQAPLALQVLLVLGQAFAMFSTLQFIVSTDPTQSRFVFLRVAMATMGTFVIEALVRHGSPGMSTLMNMYKAMRGTATQQDVKGIFDFAMDENTHLIFYASLLFSAVPAMILLIPVMPGVLLSFAKRCKILVATRVPALAAVLSPQLDRITSSEAWLKRTSANAEVVILAILIFEIFTPRRNLLFLILYVQLLRVRFLVNANTREAWKTFEGYADSLFLHAKSPAVVQTSYTRFKAFAQSYAIPKK